MGMSPERPYFHRSRWPRRVALDRLDRPQPRITGHQASADPLEAHRVFHAVEVQVPQLDLAVGIREGDRPRDGPPIVVLLDQVARMRPHCRHSRS
jgi:hypothetical protein